MEKIIITQDYAGQRLDKFLTKYFREASVGFLYKMLRKKNITLNGKKAAGGELLQDRDEIRVFFSAETFSKMKGSAKDEFQALAKLDSTRLSVIGETQQIAVLNKPAGMLTQKAKADEISINELFLSHLIHTGQMTLEDYEQFHPSVANRLDYNTTGIVLAGKTLQGQQELSRMLRERDMIKHYHCLVYGNINECRHLKGYLCKDRQSNRVTITDTPAEGSRPIETEYRPLQQLGKHTLLQVHLITGRPHQIRAHLASIGYPILGDAKYGDGSINRRYHVVRQMLHAYSVTFPDHRVYIAEYPDDMKALINALS